MLVIDQDSRPACRREGRRPGHIHVSLPEPSGAAIFAHACKLGREGIVSKHREHAYQAGPSKAWLKTKNPAAPVRLAANMSPVTEPMQFWPPLHDHGGIGLCRSMSASRALSGLRSPAARWPSWATTGLMYRSKSDGYGAELCRTQNGRNVNYATFHAARRMDRGGTFEKRSLVRLLECGAYWPSRFSSEIAPSYSTKVLGQVSAATCNDALASPLLPRSSSHSPA
jgi:hypothetical protein